MKQISPWWWLWLALIPGCGISATNIVGIHAQEQDQKGYTTLVLDLDGPTGVNLFTLDNPDRIVVDLPGVRINSLHRIRAAKGALLHDVRAAYQGDGRLRIVLDVAHQLLARNYFTVSDKKVHLVIELRDSSMAPREIQTATLAPPSAASTPPQPAAATEAPVVSAATPGASTHTTSPPNATVPHSDPAKTGPTAHEPTDALPPPPKLATTAPLREERPPGHIPVGVTPKPLPTVAATLAPPPAPVVMRGRDIVVAIDAGHGGKDPGTTGQGGTEEKTITLTVARYVVDLLRKEHGFHPILTRNGDYFVPLRERIQKARAFKADLFISIHADAAHDTAATGASVYILSERGASSEAARMLAEQENAVDLIGGVHLGGGHDNNLARTLLDMSQSATREASVAVANRILNSMGQIGNISRDTVERAGFLVLKSPDVPSVLVETAYLSNPEEETKLNDPNYQQTIARAITRGVRAYFVHSPPTGTLLAQLAENPLPPTELVRR